MAKERMAVEKVYADMIEAVLLEDEIADDGFDILGYIKSLPDVCTDTDRLTGVATRLKAVPPERPHLVVPMSREFLNDVSLSDKYLNAHLRAKLRWILDAPDGQRRIAFT